MNSKSPFYYILILGFFVSSSIAYVLFTLHNNSINQLLSNQSVILSKLIVNDLNNKTIAIERMADRWESEYNGTPYDEWMNDAKNYVLNDNSIQAIEWVDVNGIVQWVVPLKGNEQALGLDLGKEKNRRAALTQARKTNESILSKPITLVQGGVGLLQFIPLQIGNVFDGYILVVLNVNHWLNTRLRHELKQHKIDIYFNEQYLISLNNEQPISDAVLSQLTPLNLDAYSAAWTLKISPKQEHLDELGSYTPLFGFILSILMTILIAVFYLRNIESLTAQMKLKSQHKLAAQKAAMDEHSLVSITDLDGAITYVNEKFCEVSGYSKEELLGGHHRVLNSKKEPKNYWKNMYLRCSKGEVWHDEVKNKAKSGDFYWVDTTILPNYDSNGRLEGYTSIYTDISANKKQEEHLIDAKISAEAASIAKNQFLSTMSHEIRTPMNGVLGMAQLLEDTPLNDEQKDYLQTITRSGNSLLSIINDILDFSKLDANMTTLESIAFDLERVCQESMELLASKVSDKNLEFIFDYQPNCPRHFIGDPTRIRQVIINLLGNAIKFTSKGFIRLGVSVVETKSSGTHIRLNIQDTGLGLKQKDIKNLFTEFTQADTSTTRKFGGTGLGLAITKKITSLMGANIGVDSIYGEGSTFWVSFNLAETKAPKSLMTKSLDDVPIMFVDDNKTNQRIFKRQLEHLGATVTMIENPLQVINVLLQAEANKKPYKIAILAQDMNDSMGINLGADIRAHAKFNAIKLMAVSKEGKKGDALLFSQAGFNAYLNKFSRLDTFRDMLSEMLNHQPSQAIITQRSIEDAKQAPTIERVFTATVLVAEDILPNQMIAKSFLTKMGVTVDVVNDGKEALDAYIHNNYDLILMDCRMPIMDGYEATRLIRAIEKDSNKVRTPIIALTANASNEDRLLCQQAGLDDVVTKPFKRADLSNCLSQWLPQNGEVKAAAAMKGDVAKVATATLDATIYQQLHDDMGEDIDDVLEAIHLSINRNLGLLSAQYQHADINDMLLWIHSMKGPAGHLGAFKLFELLTQLELGLKENDRGKVFGLVSEALKEYKLVKEEIKPL